MSDASLAHEHLSDSTFLTLAMQCCAGVGRQWCDGGRHQGCAHSPLMVVHLDACAITVAVNFALALSQSTQIAPAATS